MPSVFVKVGYFSSYNSCVHGSLNPVNPCNGPSVAASDARTGSAQFVTISGSASLTALYAAMMEVKYALFGAGSPTAGVLDKPASPAELLAVLPAFFFAAGVDVFWVTLLSTPPSQTLLSNDDTNKYQLHKRT